MEVVQCHVRRYKIVTRIGYIQYQTKVMSRWMRMFHQTDRDWVMKVAKKYWERHLIAEEDNGNVYQKA